MSPLIITHTNCIDGCCSQAILKARFNYNANYMDLDHVNLDEKRDPNARTLIEKIQSQRDSEVYIADFCLPQPMLETLLNQNNKVVVIDHHIDNLKQLTPLQEQIKNGKKLNLDIAFSMDNTESGALLTWKYLYPNLEVPLAVKHVSAGDVWKFDFGDSTKHFYTGILKNFEEPKNIPDNFWQSILSSDNVANTIIDIGKPLYDKYMQEVHELSLLAKPVMLNGLKGAMVEASKKYTSDLGNYLCLNGAQFGLVYFLEDSGIVRCSLRSVAPITVNDIAKKLEGGGHPHASAFRAKDFNEFKNILAKEGNDVDQLFGKEYIPTPSSVDFFKKFK